MPQNSQPLSLEEALQQMRTTLPVAVPMEQIALDEAAGRVLAEDVGAPLDLPPFRASAMDGYALRRADLDAGTALAVAGESLAGHPFAGAVGPGQCIRIFTGAAVPDAADQVIPQEEVAERSDATVRFKPHSPSESFIRPVGHDVCRGDRLAGAGQVLDPFALGALCAAGIDHLRAYGRLRVGVFSTGDELVDPGTPADALRPGQIYDSNRFTLLELLRRGPFDAVDLGRLPDAAQATRKALGEAADHCHALITSGGVSVGDADFVTDALRALGQLAFWKLKLKPGKPLAFGRLGTCAVFGLPGNPVSTIVTFLLVACPALMHMAGAAPRTPLRIPARLEGTIRHTPGRAEYVRATVGRRDGALVVSSTGDQSSNRLSSFAGANCLIEVPEGAGDLSSGDPVQVIVTPELLI